MSKFNNDQTDEEVKAKETSSKNSRSKNSRKNSKSKGQAKNGKSSNSKASDAALQTNTNIINNAASISYFTALGRKLGLSNVNPFSQYVEYDEQRIPGIMVLNYVQGPGIAAENADPINIAADSVYSYVRHMNSGAANYDSNDMMVYLLGAAEMYAYWAFAVRALGLINVYDTTNVYLPRTLIEAAGFDFDDLKDHQTQLRGAINTSAAEMCAYAVPDIFPYFQRVVTMTSRVFTDRDVLKPQLYVFRPEISRIYSEATSDKGAELLPERIPAKLTVAQWTTRMNALINAFRRSEDCGIISGDILKAYGRENCVTMPPIDETYTVLPIYDEDWLAQIHNARILTWDDDISSDEIDTFKIYSDVDSGLVKYLPIHRSINCAQLPFLLDSRLSEPTPGNTMVATRMIPNVTYGIALVENKRVWAIQSAGTEIVVSAAIYSINNDGETVSYPIFSTIYEGEQASANFRILREWSKFDWAPLVFEVIGENLTTANPKYTVEGVIGELANYAVVSGTNINEMHRAELLEAFRIPYDGSY